MSMYVCIACMSLATAAVLLGWYVPDNAGDEGFFPRGARPTQAGRWTDGQISIQTAGVQTDRQTGRSQNGDDLSIRHG